MYIYSDHEWGGGLVGSADPRGSGGAAWVRLRKPLVAGAVPVSMGVSVREWRRWCCRRICGGSGACPHCADHSGLGPIRLWYGRAWWRWQHEDPDGRKHRRAILGAFRFRELSERRLRVCFWVFIFGIGSWRSPARGNDAIPPSATGGRKSWGADVFRWRRDHEGRVRSRHRHDDHDSANHGTPFDD